MKHAACGDPAWRWHSAWRRRSSCSCSGSRDEHSLQATDGADVSSHCAQGRPDQCCIDAQTDEPERVALSCCLHRVAAFTGCHIVCYMQGAQGTKKVRL